MIAEQNFSGCHWLIHDSVGRILRYGVAPDEAGAVQQIGGADEHLMLLDSDADIDDERHWISNGQVTPRPTLAFDKMEIIADGQDRATLTGLPDPVTVLVDGHPQEVQGGQIEMVTTMPASYVIEIEDPFPARPFRAEVVAHAP